MSGLDKLADTAVRVHRGGGVLIIAHCRRRDAVIACRNNGKGQKFCVNHFGSRTYEEFDSGVDAVCFYAALLEELGDS